MMKGMEGSYGGKSGSKMGGKSGGKMGGSKMAKGDMGSKPVGGVKKANGKRGC